MGQCPSCGADLADEARFCSRCGAAIVAGPPTATAFDAQTQQTQAVASDYSPGQPTPVQVPAGATTVVVQQRTAPGSPGIGVAGFVLVIVGLFVPLVGLVGLILSIFGYTQAKREGLSTGLSLAGIIIGAIATVIGLIILLVFIGGVASSTSTSTGVIMALG